MAEQDFPYTSDPAPCSYCGTTIDDEDMLVSTGERHTTLQCREYVKAALVATKRELAELHAMAAKHNPKPPSPERVAEFRARMAAIDANVKMDRVLEFMFTDDERDPHRKAVLQLGLAEFVAMLLSDGEAKAKRLAEREAEANGEVER